MRERMMEGKGELPHLMSKSVASQATGGQEVGGEKDNERQKLSTHRGQWRRESVGRTTPAGATGERGAVWAWGPTLVRADGTQSRRVYDSWSEGREAAAACGEGPAPPPGRDRHPLPVPETRPGETY